MCSIAGFDFIDKLLINRINKVLSHRGQDDRGTYMDNKVSLGHNRLSIIDLSKAAHQPMSNEDGSIWVVYNGEIYNFQKIKESLEKKHKFNSNTDTEVIIHAYEEWGSDCVKRFNGMWAFCLYDSNKKIFFLSRDRTGKKPLYYYFDKEKFIFSSEIKGVLEDKSIKREINRQAIDFFLSLGFIPSPHSIFRNLNKLEKSQNLIYDLTKKEIKKYYYYHPPKFLPEYNRTRLINKGKDLLEDSVHIRKIADVEVGTFLSGGVDSSVISSILKRISPKLHTFSIGFEEQAYDESKYANLMADYLGTNHHHEYFTKKRSEERRVGKECRSRWSPYH